jgi:hypothetical protein
MSSSYLNADSEKRACQHLGMLTLAAAQGNGAKKKKEKGYCLNDATQAAKAFFFF